MARTLIYTPDPSYRYYISWLDNGNPDSTLAGSLYGAMIHADDLAFAGMREVEVYMEENDE